MSSGYVLAVPIEHKILLSRDEAARSPGISTKTLDKLVATGEIHARRIGGDVRGRVLFSRQELLRFAEAAGTSKG
jgi:excisionase family DNA binding protein